MLVRALTQAQLGAWLVLAHGRGLAPAALRPLLSAFGDAPTIIAQPFRALAEIAGEATARAVAAAAQADIRAQVERTRAWAALPGNALVAQGDPTYPSALLTLHDPPPLLYVSGQIEWLHAPSVAIVGSRSATPQGLDDAARFARELARSGLAIVSGLALGVDAAAHRGALEGCGATVAVVGTGADLVYPAKHRALAQAVAAHGAIVSEWPLGTPAKPAHFPQRNRLIAGLTQGVLVVEAAPRSGSLITARLANEMGRDVFAIPGSIHAPLSRGCHALIKDGAKLTETPSDVLDELLGLARLPTPSPPAPASGVMTEPDACSVLAATASSEAVGKAQGPSSSARAASRRLRAGRAITPDSSSLTGLPLFDSPSPALSSTATRVLNALGHAPAALEILAARTEMDSATLQGALLELELRGCVTVLPGGRYVRHARV